MPYSYKYTDTKKGRVIFQTVQPNHVSDEDVDKMCLEATGRDFRLEKAFIEKEIRLVPGK